MSSADGTPEYLQDAEKPTLRERTATRVGKVAAYTSIGLSTLYLATQNAAADCVTLTPSGNRATDAVQCGAQGDSTAFYIVGGLVGLYAFYWLVDKAWDAGKSMASSAASIRTARKESASNSDMSDNLTLCLPQTAPLDGGHVTNATYSSQAKRKAKHRAQQARQPQRTAKPVPPAAAMKNDVDKYFEETFGLPPEPRPRTSYDIVYK